MELCGSKKTQRGLAEQDYSVATLSVVLGEPKLLSEVDIKRARGRYCVPTSRSVPAFSLDFWGFMLFYLLGCFLMYV